MNFLKNCLKLFQSWSFQDSDKAVNTSHWKALKFAYMSILYTETPILWPLHEKSWLVGKNPDAGRDWGQEEKGLTGDEMAGWHHRLNGHEFEYTLGVGDGQKGLACCSPRGCKESDMTERLNWLTGWPSWYYLIAHFPPTIWTHTHK